MATEDIGNTRIVFIKMKRPQTSREGDENYPSNQTKTLLINRISELGLK